MYKGFVFFEPKLRERISWSTSMSSTNAASVVLAMLLRRFSPMLLSQRDFSRSVGIRESVGRCSVYDRARIAVLRLLHLLVLVPSSNILIPKRFVSALLREANVRNCHPSASVLSLPRIARLNPTLTASRNFKDSNESEK
jgi:hypothetical protein